jgi:hypothetical protein
MDGRWLPITCNTGAEATDDETKSFISDLFGHKCLYSIDVMWILPLCPLNLLKDVVGTVGAASLS